MIKFTELEITNKLNSLTEDLREKILLLAYDDNFIKIINYKNIKTQDIINEISYITRMVALGFASKQEMFQLIMDNIGDEDDTRHIFEEIDRTILVPNNLQGAPESSIGIETDTASTDTDETANVTPQDQPTEEDKYSTHNITETAEDILKEIENPTPSPSSLPTLPVTPEVPQVSFTPTPSSIHMPTEASNVAINTIPTYTSEAQRETTPVVTTPPISTQPTPIQPNIIPTIATNPAQATQTPKEEVLDSKLTEPVVQPAKSMYYKVDPYREQ